MLLGAAPDDGPWRGEGAGTGGTRSGSREVGLGDPWGLAHARLRDAARVG